MNRGTVPFLAMLATAVLAFTTLAEADTQSPSTGAWQFLRPQLYGERDIGEVGDQLMSIEAPASTPDPSATPVVLRISR